MDNPAHPFLILLLSLALLYTPTKKKIVVKNKFREQTVRVCDNGQPFNSKITVKSSTPKSMAIKVLLFERDEF